MFKLHRYFNVGQLIRLSDTIVDSFSRIFIWRAALSLNMPDVGGINIQSMYTEFTN